MSITPTEISAYLKELCCVAVSFFNFVFFCIKTGAVKNGFVISEQPISADLVLAKNKYVLTGTLSGTCASINTVSNIVAWRTTLSSPVFASPALYDSDKYVVFAEVNGEIHCRTVEKGIKVCVYVVVNHIFTEKSFVNSIFKSGAALENQSLQSYNAELIFIFSRKCS